MLLIIILTLITASSIILVYCNNKFWNKDVVEILAISFGIIGGIALFLTSMFLVINLCVAPIKQAEYEERYYKLEQKVQHIDSFNKEEITKEVDKWNSDYRMNIHGANSPWVNWFYTIDTSTTNLIEVNY